MTPMLSHTPHKQTQMLHLVIHTYTSHTVRNSSDTHKTFFEYHIKYKQKSNKKAIA